MTAENIQIADGDMILKGASDYEIIKSTKELANAHRVSNVDIKDFGGSMAHYEVTAK